MDIIITNPVHTQSKSASEILHTKGLLNTKEDNSVSNNKQEKLIWEEKLAKEQEEWDALDNLKNSVSGVVTATEDVTFSEALQYFQNQLFDLPLPVMKSQQRSRFSNFFRFLFGPRPLIKSLVKEQDLVFNITQVSLDNDDKLHCRVLQTIYKRLTGSNHNCPRFGSHWDIIGFQGNDPATDLRGAGFLALLQLLFLVTENKSIANEIYKLSLHPEQNFPFCLVSINVTRIALLALRNEKLSSICNKRKQVISTINDFYLAVFWNIYETWKNEFKTMVNSGHVLKAAETNALKNPTVLLKNLEILQKEKQKFYFNFAPHVATRRISASSSLSDSSIRSPTMPSQSLDAVLQPFEQELDGSQCCNNPHFAGVFDLMNEN